MTGTLREPEPTSELEYNLVLLVLRRTEREKGAEVRAHTFVSQVCVSVLTLRPLSCKIDHMRRGGIKEIKKSKITWCYKTRDGHHRTWHKVNLDSRFRGQILSESDHIIFLTWLTITIHLPELVSRGTGEAMKCTVITVVLCSVLPISYSWSWIKEPVHPLKWKGRPLREEGTVLSIG